MKKVVHEWKSDGKANESGNFDRAERREVRRWKSKE